MQLGTEISWNMLEKLPVRIIGLCLPTLESVYCSKG